MTTRFPQLPVMGHVPKKRAKPILPPLTLEEIEDVLNSACENAMSHDSEYAISSLHKYFVEAAKAKKKATP